MTDGIEIRDGRACVAWNGEPPWYKVGYELDAHATPGQMMAAAGVDWGVELHAMYSEIRIGDKTKRVRLDGKALLRDDDHSHLTTTGSNWHPIQNEQAFDFFADFVEKGQLEMNTAGALNKGRLVWALAKGRGSFAMFRGRDRIETYVLFSNPHVYGKSAAVMVTPIRVVSGTTMVVPRSKNVKLSARIAHRRKFDSAEVSKLLADFTSRITDYQGIVEYLATKRLDDAAFKNFLREVFPSKNEREELSRQAQIAAAVLETQPGAELGAGTWWAAYCAVTFTIDHLMGQQYKSESDDIPMRNRRLYAAWFGYTARRKVMALDLATEYAKKSRTA